MKFKYLILASAVCGAWYVGIQAEKATPDIQELSKQLWGLTKDGGAKLANDKVLSYIGEHGDDRYYRSDKESFASINKRIVENINRNLESIKKSKEDPSKDFVTASKELLAQQIATPRNPDKLSAAQTTFSGSLAAYQKYLTEIISEEDKALKSTKGFGPQWDALWAKEYVHKQAQTSLNAINAYHNDLTQINTIIEKNAREVLQNIKDLLGQGANPTIRFGDYSKTSSIENAIKRKDLGMLAAIFDWPDTGEKVWRQKIDSPVGDGFNSYTLLMQACESKDPALIAFFLERGANPNAITTGLFGVNTPLSILLGRVYSVDGTTLKCLQELLKEGANPVSLEETLIKKVSNNPNAILAISDLESHMKQEFQDLFEQLQSKIRNQEYAAGEALLNDPLYKVISELLRARIIYTANIKPLSEKAGPILNRIFKGYLDIIGTFVATDKNFDPINNPYPYGKDDVKGKTPIELLVANGNSSYLAMLLESKRSDNGQSLVSLTTAQNAFSKATDAQCKALLQHFIDYETALTEHSDIMPFKNEELKNIEILLTILASNIEKKRYKQDAEGINAQQALTTTIADRLHALLIYEVSKPTKEDKKTKALRRGDSKMVEKYLRYVNGLRLPEIAPNKTLVDEPFSYGDDTVKGKTPIQLAKDNKHKYCLKQMQDFLTKKVSQSAK